MVPHLVTALTGPINELEQRILDSMPPIERWFRLEWMEHTPLFYTSVDVRNAGFKLAPVSNNLFPGGWNNLTPAMLPLAVQAAMAAIEKICPEARNLLIIPQNQAHSMAYWQNLAQLRSIFRMAGLNVCMGSISPDIKQSTTMELPGGESITLEPVVRSQYRLGAKHFDPCTILLNHDLQTGVPGILEDLHEQYLLPPLHAASSVRLKSTYLRCYEEVVKRFGKLIGVDAWLMNPLWDTLPLVNVDIATDQDRLRDAVDAMLTKVRKRYKEYGIKEKAFVVLKADNHDRSFRAMAVRDAKELGPVWERLRAAQKAAFGEPLTLVLQEGVHTHERVNDAVAEPVVYLMDRYVVGGFYRVLTAQDQEGPVVDPHANFVPLAFADSTQLPQPGMAPGASAPNRFYMYGVVARLAMLAAAYELEATDPQAEHYE
ncbi:glutamate--cysteine ligase [Curvibacter sp. APW13]|uniref:glutamate--cysteine ligase n=1 Tax=Curvibacter sp. APW13 TaxID=3077236 RepID=UPI0028E01930|nr:glutamate--cysteine ligase [Curvibacter sp. APW13]MDT8990015.1 glutamate--cysteine ligase [Curvibacter sp. APW13]